MDKNKLIKPLDDNENAKQFSKNFIETFATPAFGAISKTEVDNLVFGLLVKVGALDPKSQVYEIARDLNVTPAKARNLLFQWQLRSMGSGDVLKNELADALTSIRFAKDKNYLNFGIESPLLREELRSRLKYLGIYADASFSPEIIKISIKHFVDFLDRFHDADTKDKMIRALIKDKHLKDKSFKAVTCRVIEGVAKKVGGAAGAEVTDFIGGVVRGFIKGDDDSVAEAADDIDD